MTREAIDIGPIDFEKVASCVEGVGGSRIERERRVEKSAIR